MTYQDIKNKLVEIVAFHLGVDKKELKGITTKSELYQKFEPDSLDEMEIVMSIEETFDIEFRYDENMGWATLDDIVRDVSFGCKMEGNIETYLEIRELKDTISLQEKQIKALQEKLKEYNELKDTLKRFINS